MTKNRVPSVLVRRINGTFRVFVTPPLSSVADLGAMPHLAPVVSVDDREPVTAGTLTRAAKAVVSILRTDDPHLTERQALNIVAHLCDSMTPSGDAGPNPMALTSAVAYAADLIRALPRTEMQPELADHVANDEMFVQRVAREAIENKFIAPDGKSWTLGERGERACLDWMIVQTDDGLRAAAEMEGQLSAFMNLGARVPDEAVSDAANASGVRRKPTLN